MKVVISDEFGILRFVMNFQKTILLKQLPKYGWRVAEVKDDESEWLNLEWWEDEIWILESVWSAKAARIYGTFLVDPQAPIHGRKKGEGIWAAKASLKRLEDWKSQEQGILFFGLGDSWKDELPGFLKGLSELRNTSEECVAP